MNPSRLSRLVFLMMVSGMVACASTRPPDLGESTANFNRSRDPYWEDARWALSLLDAVQTVVRDPAAVDDLSAPKLHGAVKFIYADGNLEYPEIVQSTGKPEMDQLMLRQVASAQVPKATGVGSDVPHAFVLALDMPTPYEVFQWGIYEAFDANKVYSKDAVIGGYQGMATLSFDYLDGILSNIVITKSSQSKELDRSSLNTVERAKLPPTPEVYRGKILHMQASFCYALYQSDKDERRCPTSRDVILVTGTRISRR